MSNRDIMRRVHEDPDTDSKDILATLIALKKGGTITKYDVARIGKMSVRCAHYRMHRLVQRGHFTSVRRMAANGADRPTLYQVAQDDGPTDGQEMAA